MARLGPRRERLTHRLQHPPTCAVDLAPGPCCNRLRTYVDDGRARREIVYAFRMPPREHKSMLGIELAELADLEIDTRHIEQEDAAWIGITLRINTMPSFDQLRFREKPVDEIR